MELFTAPRKLESLELVDTATSDDPLIQFLERRGYTIRMIENIQQSIAVKSTPDLWGNTEPLSASEIDYQYHVDQYFLTLASERN